MPDLDKVESLFHEALVMPADPDRLEWLAAQCAGDSAIIPGSLDPPGRTGTNGGAGRGRENAPSAHGSVWPLSRGPVCWAAEE